MELHVPPCGESPQRLADSLTREIEMISGTNDLSDVETPRLRRSTPISRQQSPANMGQCSSSPERLNSPFFTPRLIKKRSAEVEECYKKVETSEPRSLLCDCTDQIPYSNGDADETLNENRIHHHLNDNLSGEIPIILEATPSPISHHVMSKNEQVQRRLAPTLRQVHRILRHRSKPSCIPATAHNEKQENASFNDSTLLNARPETPSASAARELFPIEDGSCRGTDTSTDDESLDGNTDRTSAGRMSSNSTRSVSLSEFPFSNGTKNTWSAQIDEDHQLRDDRTEHVLLEPFEEENAHKKAQLEEHANRNGSVIAKASDFGTYNQRDSPNTTPTQFRIRKAASNVKGGTRDEGDRLYHDNVPIAHRFTEIEHGKGYSPTNTANCPFLLDNSSRTHASGLDSTDELGHLTITPPGPLTSNKGSGSAGIARGTNSANAGRTPLRLVPHISIPKESPITVKRIKPAIVSERPSVQDKVHFHRKTSDTETTARLLPIKYCGEGTTVRNVKDSPELVTTSDRDGGLGPPNHEPAVRVHPMTLNSTGSPTKPLQRSKQKPTKLSINTTQNVVKDKKSDGASEITEVTTTEHRTGIEETEKNSNSTGGRSYSRSSEPSRNIIPVMLVANEEPTPKTKTTLIPRPAKSKEHSSLLPRPKRISFPRTIVTRKSRQAVTPTTMQPPSSGNLSSKRKTVTFPAPPPNRALPPPPRRASETNDSALMRPAVLSPPRKASGTNDSALVKSALPVQSALIASPASSRGKSPTATRASKRLVEAPNWSIQSQCNQLSQPRAVSTYRPESALDARMELLEKNNALLSAALMAVLRTSGELNAPVFHATGNTGHNLGLTAWETRIHRRNAASQVPIRSDASALNLYMQTREMTIAPIISSRYCP